MAGDGLSKRAYIILGIVGLAIIIYGYTVFG